MAAPLKPGWTKPSTILFAAEVPANEKALSFAIAQARESGAHLILFHAYDNAILATPEIATVRCYDYAAAACAEIEYLEPIAERVRAQGILCEIVVRPGLPADQILAFLKERPVDRVVMGTHAPGPIGKLLVGSVAEAVLRIAKIPVCIIGPHVPGKHSETATKTVVCAVSMNGASDGVAAFAAELAVRHRARLVLQHVIKPQERAEVLAGRTIEEVEQELESMVPENLRRKLSVQAMVVSGDPTEEILFQAHAQQADLVVLGAHGASAFAAIARSGVVYKVLAHAECPVITLSPTLLAEWNVSSARAHHRSTEIFLAGVF